MSQMLAGFIQQISALCFYFSKTGGKKRGRNGFPLKAVEQMLLTVPTLRLPWLLCAIKCYFSGSVVEHYVHPMYWWYVS
jgi:hypothetical protein